MLIEGGSALAGAIQGGTLTPLAVGSNKRLPEFPDLPTAAETVPGFTAAGWIALAAPVGTPETVVRKVSEDLRKVLAEVEVRNRLAAIGSYVRPSTAAEATAFIQAEQRMWNPLLEQLSRNQ